MESTKTTGYEVNGEVVATLGEVAALLGVDKVTGKDVKKGGKYADMVSLVDLGDDQWEDPKSLKVDVPQEKHPMEVDDEGEVDTDATYTSLSEEDMKNLEGVDPDEIKSTMPEFESLDELKEFIKDIDTPTLEYIATALGLEWNPTYHKNIHRMRIAMSMHKHFFPDLFQPKESKKKKAKYGDFDTDTLFEMVKEAKLDVKRSGNEHIDRMRAIMKLKDEGFLPE